MICAPYDNVFFCFTPCIINILFQVILCDNLLVFCWNFQSRILRKSLAHKVRHTQKIMNKSLESFFLLFLLDTVAN